MAAKDVLLGSGAVSFGRLATSLSGCSDPRSGQGCPFDYVVDGGPIRLPIAVLVEPETAIAKLFALPSRCGFEPFDADATAVLLLPALLAAVQTEQFQHLPFQRVQSIALRLRAGPAFVETCDDLSGIAVDQQPSPELVDVDFRLLRQCRGTGGGGYDEKGKQETDHRSGQFGARWIRWPIS